MDKHFKERTKLRIGDFADESWPEIEKRINIQRGSRIAWNNVRGLVKESANNMQKLFDIPVVSNKTATTWGTLLFHVSFKNKNEHILTIEYTHHYTLTSFDFKFLPYEINDLISSYIQPKTITIDILLTYPLNYPFVSCNHEVIYIGTTNFSDNADTIIKDYYTSKIERYNEFIMIRWAPSLQMRGDILLLMVSINDFNDVITTLEELHC
tara:strand:- start:1060 stop:1689 length:630 start_codon:yes stop_codon:yes gene_type:complete